MSSIVTSCLELSARDEYLHRTATAFISAKLLLFVVVGAGVVDDCT